MPKNEYKVIRLVGEGNWGSVYKVLRKFDHQVYAMKRVSLPHYSNILARSD